MVFFGLCVLGVSRARLSHTTFVLAEPLLRSALWAGHDCKRPLWRDAAMSKPFGDDLRVYVGLKM